MTDDRWQATEIICFAEDIWLTICGGRSNGPETPPAGGGPALAPPAAICGGRSPGPETPPPRAPAPPSLLRLQGCQWRQRLWRQSWRQRWRWRQSWGQQWRWRQRWRWRHSPGAKPGGMAAKLAASMALAA
eukprot:gene12804-biopygen12054